jgi:UDPglucose 6-dehydrogenase
MKISIVGAGYVGLVTGACLSEFGFDVTCIDKEQSKIDRLKNNDIPIYEPGLEDLVKKNVQAGGLHFTTDLAGAVAAADVVFIAVGTPSRRGEDSADMAYVHTAAKDIARAMDGFTVVVTKSTVPVGTARVLKKMISEANRDADFDIASNPEFLREGCAVNDFLNPDRVVIGTEAKRAEERLAALYQPLSQRNIPIVFTSLESAEVIKYAANAYLAMRIGFVNELSDFCDTVGADIQTVATGMGMDNRIGLHYLQPGPGFGGSCFPKDTRALAQTARSHGTPITIIEAVIASNEARMDSLAQRIISRCGNDVKGKKFGVLGVAFKADTDDMREAPALTLIPAMQAAGAEIAAFDPVARVTAEPMFEGVRWADDPYDLAQNCDGLIILTEWNAFRGLDLDQLAGVMKTPLMFDFRNIYAAGDIAKTAFTYHSVGRAALTGEKAG